jgi:predicted nucleic acid-binding protein
MYVLDSNAIIEIIEEGPHSSKLISILKDFPLVTTSITLHEVLAGSMSDKSRFVFEGIFSTMRILEHDAPAARAGAAIQKSLDKKGQKINKMDVLIAGICTIHDATIVTLDKDFKKVQGLKVAGV